MPEQRHVFRLSRSLVVAIPPQVREHLGIDRGQAVYWHLARGGEAVITARAQRIGGRPEGLALERKLIAVEAELLRLRQRNEARDRTMYAEGWNAGAITTETRLMGPDGPSARRAHRRMFYRHVFRDATPAPPKPPRRRSARTEVVPGPDSLPLPGARPSPSAQVHEEGASPARHTPDPLPSSGLFEEGGVGAGRPLPGQPMSS
jgi:hypothetical protein